MLEGSSRGSRRAFIWVTTGLALVVVAACFATSEDVLAGAVAATRYSARFSGLVMAAAVVARAPWPVVWSRRRTELTFAFVAAHGVHYASVVLRALVEPGNRLRSFAIEIDVFVFLGFLLLALVAATARATTEAGRRANAIFFYFSWTALALASGGAARAHPSSAVVFVALILAMAWRIGSGLSAGRFAPGVRT
jgi:hypothetical protein